MKYCLATALLLAGMVRLALPGGQTETLSGGGASEEKTIEELVRELGSDRFAVRDAAVRKLMALDEAAPRLREALKSPDPEVARQAALILDELARRRAGRLLEKAKRLAEAGEIDLLVETLVRERGLEEEASLQVVTGLAAKLVELGKPPFTTTDRQRRDERGMGDFRRYIAAINPQRVAGRAPVIHEAGQYMVRGEEVTVRANISNSLVLSSGSVRTEIIISSVIFAGGDVSVRALNNAVVVCDGDFTVRETAHRCLVVARGSVVCLEDMIYDCVVFAGKDVRTPKKSYPTISRSQVKENEPAPWGFVKFFDPARAGITVKDVEEGGGVRVEAAAPGKPFAQAGLQAGDLVVAVDDTPARSAEAFRRLLRGKFVQGGEMVLKAVRAGKPLEVAVRLQE